LVRNLVGVVSRGGNYLLNVGPTVWGTFQPEALERLQTVGQWMATYHEAIYGSTFTPLQGLPWGQATCNSDRLYLHIFEWPAENKLEIEAFPGTVRNIHMLGGELLAFTRHEQHLEISLPSQAPDLIVSVLVAEINSSEAKWSNFSVGATNGTVRNNNSQ
jgi:alpha-L-fucosidase